MRSRSFSATGAWTSKKRPLKPWRDFSAYGDLRRREPAAYELDRTGAADRQLGPLDETDAGQGRSLGALRAALGLLQQQGPGPPAPGLLVRPLQGPLCARGGPLFEAWLAEGGSGRIVFCYPPGSRERIHVVAVASE